MLQIFLVSVGFDRRNYLTHITQFNISCPIVGVYGLGVEPLTSLLHECMHDFPALKFCRNLATTGRLIAHPLHVDIAFFVCKLYSIL